MEESGHISNDDWFKANLLDLVQKYPRQWIAVSNGAVIASGASRGGVRSEARRASGGRDFSLYFIEPSILQMGPIQGSTAPEERSE